MIPMQTVEVHKSPDEGITGYDLKELREGAGLSFGGLAVKMRSEGWEWNKMTVSRLEEYCAAIFYIGPGVMQSLLKALNTKPS